MYEIYENLQIRICDVTDMILMTIMKGGGGGGMFCKDNFIMYRDEQRGWRLRVFVNSHLYPRFCIIPAKSPLVADAVSLKTLPRYNITLRHILAKTRSGNNWICEERRWGLGYLQSISCSVPVSHNVLHYTLKFDFTIQFICWMNLQNLQFR